MTLPSKGAAALSALGKTRSLRSIAKELGTSHSVVCRWIADARHPGIGFAVSMRDKFKIPVEAWLEPAEVGSGGAVEHAVSDGAERVQFTELDEEIHDSEDSDARGAT